MLPLHRSFACAVVGTVLLAAHAASALSIQTLATPFTGDPVSVNVVLTDVDGDIRVDLEVWDGVGDIRGVFLNLSDTSVLDGLSASGTFVTGFATGGVIDLGQGNNLNGGGSPCPCDLGVALGTPGMGKDDIQAASFVLSHESLDLSLDLFSEQWLGVRVTSVGGDGKKKGGREGSAKLAGRLPDFTPVPEPSTALMLGLGLVGIARAGRRRREP